MLARADGALGVGDARADAKIMARDRAEEAARAKAWTGIRHCLAKDVMRWLKQILNDIVLVRFACSYSDCAETDWCLTICGPYIVLCYRILRSGPIDLRVYLGPITLWASVSH